MSEALTTITTERLPDEPAGAYEEFRIWLDLGEKRSHGAVAKKVKKKVNVIHKNASKYRWKERLITWHAEQSERERAAEEQAALEKARERLARKNEVEESAWDLFKQLRAKVVDMLKFPVARQTVTRDEKGKTVTTIIEPMRWRFSDVARVAEVADGLARLSTGMATSNGKLSIGDANGEPLPVPVQTLIQVAIVRSKEAATGHDYKILKGEPDEEDEKQAAEA